MNEFIDAGTLKKIEELTTLDAAEAPVVRGKSEFPAALPCVQDTPDQWHARTCTSCCLLFETRGDEVVCRMCNVDARSFSVCLTAAQTPVEVPDPNGFKKWDKAKPKLSILMSAWRGLALPAEVMHFGAKKYGRDNWKLCADVGRYREALLRHAGAIEEGESLDPDSGLPHIGHLACNAIFLCWFYATKKWEGGL